MSVTATSGDRNISDQLLLAIERYETAAEKMKVAVACPDDESNAFEHFASDCNARVVLLQRGLQKLQLQLLPEPATISPAEQDAISIIETKA